MTAWQPIETAPPETLLLVWGNGPSRFGYRDNLGNWRARHHGALTGYPTHWMLLPEPPGTTSRMALPKGNADPRGTIFTGAEAAAERMRKLNAKRRGFTIPDHLMPGYQVFLRKGYTAREAGVALGLIAGEAAV